MRVQVLGLLRFSYPSVYNKRGLDDFEAYRRSLYDPQRLARRLVWFRHVVLPSLANQSDQDFDCVLLVGDQLPQPFRDALAAMVAEVPQVKICWEEEGQRHRLAIKKLVEGHSDRKADYVAEMQLDDDDALGRDVVARTRAHGAEMAGHLADHQWATLDFLKGLVLQMGPEGHAVRAAHCPLWTPALMTFRRPGTPTMIRRMSHLDLWKVMPVVSRPDPLMWVRGAHEDNASNFLNRWERHCLDEDLADVPRLMSQEFGIDLAAMQAERRAAG
jgi:hypothetical protein